MKVVKEDGVEKESSDEDDSEDEEKEDDDRYAYVYLRKDTYTMYT
jgi:hypothetical protein